MLKQLLNDHQLFHSQFQQDYLITIKTGGTLYGQYKQALRELYKRFRGLREIICDNKKIIVEVKKLQHKIKWDAYKYPMDQELDQIEYERGIMQQEESQRVLNETKREFTRFYQQALALKEKIGELTTEKRKQLDKEMWIYRLKEMIALDLVSSGRISRNSYEFINTVPKDIRDAILPILKDQKKMDELIKWYETKDDIYQINYEKLPELQYTEEEILKLK